MISIGLNSAFQSNWQYFEDKTSCISRCAIISGQQWSAEDESEAQDDEDTESLGEISVFVAKNVSAEESQDLVVLLLGDDESIAFMDGEADIIFVIDDDLKLSTKLLLEQPGSKPVFLMSRHLIALFTVAKKVGLVYKMKDGSRRFAKFEMQDPLEWSLESANS